MNKLLIAILVGVCGLVTIALLSGVVQVNMDRLLSQFRYAAGPTPLPSPRPTPTITARVTPTPSPTPLATRQSPPGNSVTRATSANDTVIPTPTLSPQQVFASLDAGKITTEEAVALLSGRTQLPTNTPVPTPQSAPTPSLRPTQGISPPTDPTSGSVEQGSEEWVHRLESDVHALINVERQKNSIASLALDDQLAAVARGHSKDMAVNDYFSHDNLSGQSPTDRGNEAGYSCFKDYGSYYTQGIAENIFQTHLYSSVFYLNGVPVRKNYMSIEEIANQVVKGWMESPGHRKNILERSYDRQGIGVAISVDEKVYVTENFC